VNRTVKIVEVGAQPFELGMIGVDTLMVAALFGLAYPGRTIFAIIIVVGSALGLEVLQHLTPDRHGHVVDFFEKASGGLFGIFTVNAMRRYPPLANLMKFP